MKHNVGAEEGDGVSDGGGVSDDGTSSRICARGVVLRNMVKRRFLWRLGSARSWMEEGMRAQRG